MRVGSYGITIFLLVGVLFFHSSWVLYGQQYNAKIVDPISIRYDDLKILNNIYRKKILYKFISSLYNAPVGSNIPFQVFRQLNESSTNTLINQGILSENDKFKIELLNKIFLKSENITINHGGYGISIITWMIILSLISVILYHYFNYDKNSNLKITYIISFVIVIIGFLAYLSGLLCIYLFTFSSYDAENLSSFSRYTGTYLLAPIILCFGATLYLCQKAKNILSRVSGLMISAVLPLLIFVSAPFQFYSFFMLAPPPMLNERNKVVNISNYIKANIPEGHDFYVLWPDATAFSMFMLRYELLPTYKVAITRVWDPVLQDVTNSLYKATINKDKLYERLKGYQYLVIINNEDVIFNNYKTLSSAFRVSKRNSDNSIHIYQNITYM